jgi:hypothetical protein
MYSIHYKDSVVGTMTGRGQDKEVLEASRHGYGAYSTAF